jgi:hypothetical protein
VETSEIVARQENQIENRAATEQNALLPLDSPERAVSFRSAGGKILRHVFRRFTATDWDSCFAHMIAEFAKEKDGYTQTIDMDYAYLVLYERAIERVEGYETPGGIEPSKLPDWPECIPQHHRLRVMSLITNVSYSDDVADDSVLEAEGVSVKIDAVWNETRPGAMKQYRGLVHHFAAPTKQHRRRVIKAKSRARVVGGGGKNGVTIIPSGHGVLTALYDELIERVDGYAVNGRELTGKSEIASQMDAFHKASAVAQLFQASPREEENTETE